MIIIEKYNLDYVKEYVKKKTNGACEVVSETYVNSNTPLKIKCSCGKIFERNFRKLETRDIMCVDCSNKRMSERNRKDFSEVIKDLKSVGCEYVSGEYKNNKSILTVRCNCGNVFNRSFVKIVQGQNTCISCSRKRLAQSKIKYTIDDVRKELDKKGYTLLEDEYINCSTPMMCRCSKGHEFNLVFEWYMSGTAGCMQCYNERRGGENAWNYKGGESEVIDILRKSTRKWKKDVLASYEFNCAITGVHSNRLVIHHLHSFIDIVKEASDETGIPIERKIMDYNDGEFEILKKSVISKHDLKNGIPMMRKIHNQFHRIYGKGNNTEEQFDEFLKEYYNTDLSTIQEKRKQI